MPLPVNVITHFSAYLRDAIACESNQIPIEEYPPVHSFGPDEHGRLSTFGPALVTFPDSAVTYAGAAGARLISITVLASAVITHAFKAIFQWMLDSCDGNGIAAIPGATTTFTELVHLMAAAEVLKAPFFLTEQIYRSIERAVVNLPFDDFGNFLGHAARDHPARSLVVASVSKAYLENRLLQVDRYLECARTYDEEIYGDLKASIDEREDSVAGGGLSKGQGASGNDNWSKSIDVRIDGKKAASIPANDWSSGAAGWGGGNGSPPPTIVASPSKANQEWNSGTDGFHDISNPDNGGGDRNANDNWDAQDVHRQNNSRTSSKACRQCGDPRHFMKDCPQITCYRCHQSGHLAKNCTGSSNSNANNNIPSDQDVCRRCKEPGHRATNCTRVRRCYNCGEPGHISRECTEARKYSRKPASTGPRLSHGFDNGRGTMNGRRRGLGGTDGQGYATATVNSGWRNNAGPSSTTVPVRDWELDDETFRPSDANSGAWGPGPAIEEIARDMSAQAYSTGFRDMSARQYGDSENQEDGGRGRESGRAVTGVGGGRRARRGLEDEEADGESTEQTVRVQLEKKRGGKNGRRAYFDFTPYVL